MRKKILYTLTLAVLSFSYNPAMADPIVLKFAHEAPESAMKGQSASKLSELVKEYTNGEVIVDVYPGGQLIPTTDELRALARGQVDIIAPFTSYFSSIDKAWDVFYQPFLFENAEDAIDKFAGPVGEELLERLAERGMTGLAIWHDGPNYIFSTDKPIKSFDDLSRRKVRVFPSRPLEAGLEGGNATPVSIPATEVYMALQQGVADSVITTTTYVGPAKWNEVLKYGTKLMFGQGGYGVVANQKSLAQLNEEQKKAFMRAVQDAEKWNHKKAIENILYWEEQLEKDGLEWTELSEQDIETWKKFAEAAENAQSPETLSLIENLK